LGVFGVPLKRPKKGCFGPFGGPYGGIPKVFGKGPIGDLEGGSRQKKGFGVEMAFLAWPRELRGGVLG